MNTFAIIRLLLAERASRILALIAFAALFILSAVTARILSGGGEHLEMEQLYQMGGYPLVSMLLLLGWVLGRFPLIAVFVLMAGLFSADRAQGYARLYGVRPVSFVKLYGLRFLVLAAVAFLLSAMLLPIFDIIMLGAWAGPSTLVLIGCYVLLYGGVVALLSVFTRGEAWIALAIAMVATIWEALRRTGNLDQAPPGVRAVVSFILPPHGPLFRVESAFAAQESMPWVDIAYILGYSLVLILAAAVFIADREV